MVGAYHVTYGLPTLITRGSNTYGPYQYPEKLIPLFVTNALEGEPLPIYGDGMQQRDWLHVDDHGRGIADVLDQGVPGEIYNIGVGSERPNLEVIERIADLTGCDRSLLRYVPDRPGHDRRYALNTEKMQRLGWQSRIPFEVGIIDTVRWYAEHESWWRPIKGTEFQEYYRQQYAERLAGVRA